ncbi:sensor histidine kinase [Actinoplanes sp. CA-252034]|uniref:sensor histidine kinase n=1 Tax=Actinoplanes sp. CA-252034 TaxID=3239906 RepID=UPI003D988061
MDGKRRIGQADRLAAVVSTGLLELPAAPGLDRLTRLASRLLGVPTSLVSLVTDEQQVFASQLGLPQPWADAARTPLSHSFCQYVVDDDAPLVVTDARDDERLHDNRAIDEIGVIAYAGMPIRMDGHTLGAFCAIDGQPRKWTAAELETLEDLAAAVESEIALIKAADDAQRAAATMRAVLEASHDAYVSSDADGRVRDWNHSAEVLFGWTRAEAIGAPATELIIPEEYRADYNADIARVRAGGRSELAGRRMEMPVRHRDGHCLPVEYTVQVTDVGSPVYHAFLHDISARRSAQRQLQRQAELIDAAPAAIIVRGDDGTIRFWNNGAEQMYGWPAAAVAGQDIHRLLGTEFPESLARVEEALETTGTWEGELTHRHADGHTITVLSRHARRPAPDGGTEIIETNADITGRLQAQRELQQRNRQLEQANLLKLDLMGMLSHDIGTPLAAIAGYSELLSEEPLPEFVLGLIGRIRKSTHRIDELRHNVLAMCSLDSGTLTAARQPVLLGPALREAVDAVETEVPIDCPDHVRVLVNPAHLTQIVVNFITNAAKYGGGATAITVRNGDGAATVAVHDEGPGVPAALRPRLFDRYTRAHETGGAKGHGLGLHIVASLAQANHGAVSHRDNHPRGSVFELTLETTRRGRSEIDGGER